MYNFFLLVFEKEDFPLSVALIACQRHLEGCLVKSGQTSTLTASTRLPRAQVRRKVTGEDPSYPCLPAGEPSPGSSDVARKSTLVESGWISTPATFARPVPELTPPTGEGKGLRLKRHRAHTLLLIVVSTSNITGGSQYDGQAREGRQDGEGPGRAHCFLEGG